MANSVMAKLTKALEKAKMLASKGGPEAQKAYDQKISDLEKQYPAFRNCKK